MNLFGRKQSSDHLVKFLWFCSEENILLTIWKNSYGYVQQKTFFESFGKIPMVSFGIQVQAAAGRTQQEDLSGAFLQMVNEANQNVKIRNLRRFAWLIEALGGALVGLQ